uniref:Metalloendopeptidase n=2 Tax=Parascaris univalens TaxID=6257 RepID=A0A915BIG2_PARUN
MRHWENHTCISFVPRQPHHQNYIVFTIDKCGCCSYVGRRGDGPQAISIGKNCDKFGIVVHELGHVIGFWHEHTRLDRDDHVDIFYKSIQQSQDYNFDKLKADEVDSLGEPYDYASIMHYARDTFSRAMYLDTILPKVIVNGRRPEIGQRVQLSAGDISQTRKLYRCPVCGETLVKEYGELRLGGGVECQWRIIAAMGEILVLNVSTLGLPGPVGECASERDNFVIVRDGYYTGSPILAKICGDIASRTIFSTGNRLFVQTRTTSKLSTPFAHYIAVCGGHIVGDEGTIQSPRFPENYAPDANCNWVIKVPKKFQVALTFQYFNLEAHKDCVYDRVEIYDGAVADPNNLISKLCGQVNAESVVSKRNVVLVRFVSDSSVQKSGFHIDFVRELDECASNAHGCEQRCVNQIGGFRCECDIGFSLRSDGKTCQSTCGGIIKATNGTFFSPNFPLSYPPSKNCVWQVHADEGYQIIVNFTHFNVEGMKTECAYDYVLIEDEEGGEERYCGDYNQPLVYTSTSNRIKVHFVSDNSVEKSGFAAYFITDLDECRKDKGGCQQLCINTIGSYRCECESGYVLADDAHNCKEGGCHLQLHDPDGEITSPNFPFDYPKGKTCNWHFVTTPGHRLLLAFEEFALEEHNMCKYDHVEVFDGGDAQAPSLGVFCGNGVPPDISSSSNQLFLTMVTDASVARRGFKAFYSSVCGGELKAEETVGFIYSHARYSDDKYDKKMRCEWRILADAGRGVELRFAQFDLEKEASCDFDFVEVFDGHDRSDDHKLGHFCGDQLPPVFVSTGRKMMLVLNTDDSEERKGFVAEYRSAPPATARPVMKPTPRPSREPVVNND